jgi:hypothetical protein
MIETVASVGVELHADAKAVADRLADARCHHSEPCSPRIGGN